jgi:hypothetical protein
VLLIVRDYCGVRGDAATVPVAHAVFLLVKRYAPYSLEWRSFAYSSGEPNSQFRWRFDMHRGLWLAGCLLLLAGGCGERHKPELKGTGSTVIGPLMTQWAKEYKVMKALAPGPASTG